MKVTAFSTNNREVCHLATDRKCAALIYNPRWVRSTIMRNAQPMTSISLNMKIAGFKTPNKETLYYYVIWSSVRRPHWRVHLPSLCGVAKEKLQKKGNALEPELPGTTWRGSNSLRRGQAKKSAPVPKSEAIAYILRNYVW